MKQTKQKLSELIKDYENKDLSEYAKGRLSAFKMILKIIKENENLSFLSKKACILSEYDNDFYNAKEKIDLDLINEKIRLELYKI